MALLKGVFCHVERSRDISYYSIRVGINNNERFLDSARNDRAEITLRSKDLKMKMEMCGKMPNE